MHTHLLIQLKVFALGLLLISALHGCSKKAEEERPDIFELKEMSDLATVEYTVTKIIKASDNKTWYKVGTRKILMSCEAHIKAGIDMSKINANNFTINDKEITVHLPPPKIISFSIPPEKIRTEYQETGAFRDKFSSKERDALALQAEKQIRNNLQSLGIFEQAKANTGLFVTTFLQQLGYETVHVQFNNGNTNSYTK